MSDLLISDNILNNQEIVKSLCASLALSLLKIDRNSTV